MDFLYTGSLDLDAVLLNKNLPCNLSTTGFVAIALIVLWILIHHCAASPGSPEPKTSSMPKKPKDLTALEREALCALTTVLVPTASAWPSTYMTTLLSLWILDTSSRTVNLRLAPVLEAIRTGELELRNPDDLPGLIRGDLKVYGWRFSFEANNDSRSKKILDCTRGDIISSAPDADWFVPLGNDGPRYNFDFVPYGKLQKYLRLVVNRVENKSSIGISLTCLDSHLDSLSPKVVYCALPFASGSVSRERGHKRRSTALQLSIQDFIKVLSAQKNIVVEAARDVSNAEIQLLKREHDALISDRALRNERIEAEGEEGWRERRFLILWEAALLECGYMQRWEVKIRKRDVVS